MVPKRIHIRVIAALIVLLGITNLIILVVNLIRMSASMFGSSSSSESIPLMVALYFSQLGSILVCAVVTGAIRSIIKPFKYWMDLACNSFAIGTFLLMFVSGVSTILISIAYSSTGITSSSLPMGIFYTLVGIAFFVLGIVASKMVMKRRRPASFFYMGIIVGGTMIYLAMYFANSAVLDGKSVVANIPFILLLALESAFAVINAFTVETPSELDSFLNSIERRHPRLYNMIVKAYSGKVNTANNQVAPDVQDQATDVEETDEFVERTWTERGMVFSNKE